MTVVPTPPHAADAPDLPSADPALTGRVLDSFAAAPSPRFGQVMRSVVAHLHAAATEVGLTDEEWALAVGFLTRVGQISDDRRKEAILLSDVLGLSMLVVGMNHPADGATTESTVFGPFFHEGSPAFTNGQDISGGAAGQPCHYTGRVVDSRGAPVAGALVEVWHADEDGNYDVQNPHAPGPQNRGHLRTDADGRYRFVSVLPEPYPIPGDGPVGELLRATRRSFMRPAHIHFMISAPGLATLTTHVFRDGDPYLGTDAVFGEADSLVRAFERHGPGRTPAGDDSAVPFFTMTFDFVLRRQDDPARAGTAAPAYASPAPDADGTGDGS